MHVRTAEDIILTEIDSKLEICLLIKEMTALLNSIAVLYYDNYNSWKSYLSSNIAISSIAMQCDITYDLLIKICN